MRRERAILKAYLRRRALWFFMAFLALMYGLLFWTTVILPAAQTAAPSGLAVAFFGALALLVPFLEPLHCAALFGLPGHARAQHRVAIAGGALVVLLAMAPALAIIVSGAAPPRFVAGYDPPGWLFLPGLLGLTLLIVFGSLTIVIPPRRGVGAALAFAGAGLAVFTFVRWAPTTTPLVSRAWPLWLLLGIAATVHECRRDWGPEVAAWVNTPIGLLLRPDSEEMRQALFAAAGDKRPARCSVATLLLALLTRVRGPARAFLSGLIMAQQEWNLPAVLLVAGGLLVATVLLAYGGTGSVVFAVVGLLGIVELLPQRNPLLLPFSRGQLFLRLIAVAVALTVLTAAVGVAVACLTVVLPPVSDVAPRVAEWSAAWVVPAGLPLLFLARLLLPRSLGPAFAVWAPFVLWAVDAAAGPFSAPVQAGAVALAWALFLAAAWHHSYRGKLV